MVLVVLLLPGCAVGANLKAAAPPTLDAHICDWTPFGLNKVNALIADAVQSHPDVADQHWAARVRTCERR
jgi:hypothetical protein